MLNDVPFFVAYVYPGWHKTPYRPAVDEWELLEKFTPYFSGHSAPPKPLAGKYDDSLPDVSRRHIELAKRFGIDAFTYFLYYEPDHFVMVDPLRRSLEAAGEACAFSIAATWCIRMPLSRFPVRLVDRNGHSGRDRDKTGSNVGNNKLDDLPIEDLTLEQLEEVLGTALLESIPVNAFLTPLPR